MSHEVSGCDAPIVESRVAGAAVSRISISRRATAASRRLRSGARNREAARRRHGRPRERHELAGSAHAVHASPAGVIGAARGSRRRVSPTSSAELTRQTRSSPSPATTPSTQATGTPACSAGGATTPSTAAMATTGPVSADGLPRKCGYGVDQGGDGRFAAAYAPRTRVKVACSLSAASASTRRGSPAGTSTSA